MEDRRPASSTRVGSLLNPNTRKAVTNLILDTIPCVMTARDSTNCATQCFAQSQGPLPSRLRRGRSRNRKLSIERGLRDGGDEGVRIDRHRIWGEVETTRVHLTMTAITSVDEECTHQQ